MSESKSEFLEKSPDCFVISPIGAEGSATRMHADTVYNCIIKPACEDRYNQRGGIYTCERGDHKTAPGKITDQIYEDILAAKLIIAVLTENNPNVYYELAIAQAAAKPVILLLEKGFDAPFDIKDQRIIYYDFEPQSIFNGTYAKLLRAAIKSIEARRTRPVVPFAPQLTPLGDPTQTIGARASEAEIDSIRIVQNARKFIWLMGYSLNGWTMNEEFRTVFREASERLDATEGHDHISRGIKTLLMDARNPSLATSMRNDDAVSTAAKMIEVSVDAWSKLRQGPPVCAFELKTAAHRSVGYQIVMNEEEAIVIPYLTSRETVRSPYIYTKSDSAYYEAISEEFRHVWEDSHFVDP